jgi:hypothetical protein
MDFRDTAIAAPANASARLSRVRDPNSLKILK